MLADALHTLIHLLVALLLPPLWGSVVVRTEDVVARRVGPRLSPAYYDVARLTRKGSVFSQTTTWVFKAGPVVALASTLLATLLIPLGTHAPLLAFSGDVILLVYLFGLGRFFTASAALDTGSAFEGMGAAREVSFAALAEPAFFLGLLVLCRITGSFELGRMLGPDLETAWFAASAPLALISVSWAIVLLVENSRLPFDDPRTHLELTMIHEVMVLDHSGPAFGLVQYGAALKLQLYAALLLRTALPITTGNAWADWLVLLAGLAALAIGVGLTESLLARLKLTGIPKFLVGASLASAFAVILLAR